MALKNKFMVKQDVGTADFTLKADEGESFLIKDVLFADSASEFSELLVDRMSILALTTKHLRTNQNFFHFGNIDRKGIIQTLIDAGLWKGIPLASGQTLTVKTNYDSNKQCGIIYEVHDEGDITADMENGTKGKEYLFINYGTNGSAIADAAYGDIDKPILPSEYMNFPFGDMVPSGFEVDLLSVLTCNYGRAATKSYGLPYTKLIRGREVLFDPDRLGTFTGGGQSLFGFNTRDVAHEPPLRLLPEPLTFKAGEELTIQQQNDSGAEIAVDLLLLGVILKVRRLEA
ncbi:hypothetical protein ES703_19471 [subsurface metagenome]